jgi:hypothetical protein
VGLLLDYLTKQQRWRSLPNGVENMMPNLQKDRKLIRRQGQPEGSLLQEGLRDQNQHNSLIKLIQTQMPGLELRPQKLLLLLKTNLQNNFLIPDI